MNGARQKSREKESDEEINALMIPGSVLKGSSDEGCVNTAKRLTEMAKQISMNRL